MLAPMSNNDAAHRLRLVQQEIARMKQHLHPSDQEWGVLEELEGLALHGDDQDDVSQDKLRDQLCIDLAGLYDGLFKTNQGRTDMDPLTVKVGCALGALEQLHQHITDRWMLGQARAHAARGQLFGGSARG